MIRPSGPGLVPKFNYEGYFDALACYSPAFTATRKTTVGNSGTMAGMKVRNTSVMPCMKV